LARTSERELVRQARTGDTEAFAALVVAHQHFVYNLALRTLGEVHEAEDVAQEAFVQAWLALPRFRAQAQFQTWLYRIVVNLCYNRLPRLRRELTLLGEEVSDVPDEGFTNPARHIEVEEKRAFLHQQIVMLPENYRLLITLRYQNQLSYEEISQILNLPLGTVKTGIFRARRRLREALRQFEEE
jgi:RNA polymerase sigma-70 factor (ECF subfamily)